MAERRAEGASFLENRHWAFHLCFWLGVASIALGAYAAYAGLGIVGIGIERTLGVIEVGGGIEAVIFGVLLIACAGVVGILQDIRAWTVHGVQRSHPSDIKPIRWSE